MAPFPVKLKKPDGPTFIVPFNTLPSWETLTSSIVEYYDLPPENIAVTYIYNRRHVVTVINNQGLRAYYNSRDPSSQIEFVVQNRQNLDSADTVFSTFSSVPNLSNLLNTDENNINLLYWIIGESNTFLIKIGISNMVHDLKAAIKKKNENALAGIDAGALSLWKVKDSNPIAIRPISTLRLAERIEPLINRLPEFADELLPQDRISSIFSTQTLSDDCIHVIVKVPEPRHVSRKRAGSPTTGEVKRMRFGPDPATIPSIFSSIPNHFQTHPDAWLVELHSKIWNRRKDLSSELYHKVDVTADHYYELQKRLKELHPDRESSDYTSQNVLSTKLDFLRSVSAFAPSRVHSNIEVEDDEDSEESDTELDSFLPATLNFLDLSSLKLRNQPLRLPLPLLLREDYSHISKMIKEQPKGHIGSVVVTGQPGTGKTAFIYLKIIEFMLDGTPFLYQTINGVVYHVSQTVTKFNGSWQSEEPIVAFVDADHGAIPKPSFLFDHHVQIIEASSPGDINKREWKQRSMLMLAPTFTADLWSAREFFLTGIFLHPADLTFKRLEESASYFGFNPRHCFGASVSAKRLRHLVGDIEIKICSAKLQNFRALLHKTFTSSEDLSHSIFELVPFGEDRSLNQSQIRAVSMWALDKLLTQYETEKADAAADIYMSLASYS